jgi:hypothetical protein
MVESVFWPRLRWRMRGAWQWPAFGVLTAVDALLLARLPFRGGGADALGAVLLAGFLNLLVVAVAAPLLGVLVRLRRRDLPAVVARDYAGTALLGLVTGVLLLGGVLHHSAVSEERSDRAALMVGVHNYVVTQAPRFQGGLARPDIVELEVDHYRVCVYGRERLPLCLFVNTDQRPAGIRRDPSREPNTGLGG